MSKKERSRRRGTSTNVFISAVNEKTSISIRRLESMRAEALRLIEDQGAEERIQKCMCIACYYGAARGYMVGHAFTRWSCVVCHAVNEHPNTRVPVVCLSCAAKNRICSTCMADMRMEMRTKEKKNGTP